MCAKLYWSFRCINSILKLNIFSSYKIKQTLIVVLFSNQHNFSHFIKIQLIHKIFIVYKYVKHQFAEITYQITYNIFY